MIYFDLKHYIDVFVNANYKIDIIYLSSIDYEKIFIEIVGNKNSIKELLEINNVLISANQHIFNNQAIFIFNDTIHGPYIFDILTKEERLIKALLE